MHCAARAVVAVWDWYAMVGKTLALEFFGHCGRDAGLGALFGVFPHTCFEFEEVAQPDGL
jgi:hypothetical protein